MLIVPQEAPTTSHSPTDPWNAAFSPLWISVADRCQNPASLPACDSVASSPAHPTRNHSRTASGHPPSPPPFPGALRSIPGFPGEQTVVAVAFVLGFAGISWGWSGVNHSQLLWPCPQRCLLFPAKVAGPGFLGRPGCCLAFPVRCSTVTERRKEKEQLFLF